MTRTQHTTRWLGALAALALALTACGGGGDTGGGGDGGDGGGGLAEQDTITVGIANEVPYGFEEGGEVKGEAPAVARAVLDEMGISSMEAEVVDFGALISGLNAGQFDMIAAGMFITEERASQALFTDPDYCATTAFAVPEGNPDNLSDFQSVIDAGITLGVLSGAVEAGYAEANGVQNLETFQTTPDLVDALTTGRIDAFALTAVTVRTQTQDLEGFESTEGFIPVVDGEEQLGCGGFVFNFKNKDFRDQFNEILVEMRENDEILPLIKEFNFTQAETEAAKGVTVEDLIGKPYDFGMTGGGGTPTETGS